MLLFCREKLPLDKRQASGYNSYEASKRPRFKRSSSCSSCTLFAFLTLFSGMWLIIVK